MHGNVSRLVLGLALTALAAGAGGCGSRQYAVTGKVTYNGAPLASPDGQIVFIGPRGNQVAANIGTDGTYRAAKVPAGPNRVVVYYPNPKAPKGRGQKLRPGEQPPPPVSPFLTPSKYAVAETSGLATTVESDTVFDADLTGPKIP